MNTLRYLTEYDFARQALVAAVAVGTVCSLLSVVVVLKRMAFIGQGISHAGFGGIGIAAFLGLHGSAPLVVSAAVAPYLQDAIVVTFCLGTAVVIGMLSRRRRVEVDTAIGILLVAAMAVGVFLDQLRLILQQHDWYRSLIGVHPPVSYDQLLFGSINNIGIAGMWTAVVLAIAVILAATLLFKEILFYSFDEVTSRVFGVRSGLIHFVILVLLTLTTVMAMKLTGVVLVSALLVIPGAAAVQLSRRLGVVLVLAWVIGMVGTVGGLMLSFELDDFPTGPCMVAVLCVLFAGACATRWWTQRA